jgi:hypothetical protein
MRSSISTSQSRRVHPPLVELTRPHLVSGTVALGAIFVFSRRPFSGASRLFIGPILKGSKGSAWFFNAIGRFDTFAAPPGNVCCLRVPDDWNRC